MMLKIKNIYFNIFLIKKYFYKISYTKIECFLVHSVDEVYGQVICNPRESRYITEITTST
jgi:hypothetical protein